MIDYARIALALSGEVPTRAQVEACRGISLVRAEYLYKAALLYPTERNARASVVKYMTTLCALTSQSVAYRTLEVTQAEANVLRGVEEVTNDVDHDMLGLRGVRRHMAYPGSLIAELEALSEVRLCHNNFHVIAPFVSDIREFTWYQERVAEVVGDVEVVPMIEVPSLVLQAPELVRAGV